MYIAEKYAYYDMIVVALGLFDWPFRASPCDDIICGAHFLFDWQFIAISQTFANFAKITKINRLKVETI